MKNYKKGFVGIIVAIAIVAVSFLGYGAYKAFHEDSPIQIYNSVNISDTGVSEQMILNALNKNGGGCITEQGAAVPYTKGSRGLGCSSDVTTLYAGNFYYGDINNDGFEDVIFISGSCGASCGNSLMAGVNQKNGTIKIIGISPSTWVSSGATQTSLKNISIDYGIINISANGYSDSKNWDDIITKKFKFENDKLIEIKTNLPVINTSSWKTYKNDKYGFEFKYPSNWKQSDIDYGGADIVFVKTDDEKEIKKGIKPDTDNIVVALEGEAVFLELDKMIDDRDKKYISEIHIDNKKIYKFETNYDGNLFGGGLLEGYFFPKSDGKHVYIGVHYWSDKPSDNLRDTELRTTLKSIIPTFKFTK